MMVLSGWMNPCEMGTESPWTRLHVSNTLIFHNEYMW